MNLSFYVGTQRAPLSSPSKKNRKKEERKIEFSTKIEFLKIRGNDYLIAKKMETKTNISNKSQVYHLFYLFFSLQSSFLLFNPFS